jgi:predicted TPR repeat methyltransferase
MAESRKPDVARAVAAGIAHHRAGRLTEAEEAYRQVLVTDPENFDALCLLGAIAHDAGRHHHAIDYIGRAIAHAERTTPPRPPNPYAYSNLGEAYRATGQIGNATQCYERALAIKPDYAEAHYHLGLVLADEGRHQDAIACYRRAISLKPELVLAQYNLGLALKAQGNVADATACLREVLRLDPGNELATFSLSSLTAQNPERPPERYIANLFDNHAPRFDAHLVETLRYRVPRALVAIARRHAEPPQSGWDVLDLGCGTGLVGAAVAPFAHHLVGVDLSLRMLEKARERNLYGRLEHRDLLSLMKVEPASSYDLIAAADVFIYVGKLADVVREAARLLRVGGALVFSVEAIEKTPSDATGAELPRDYRLLASGRYAHSADYLRQLARDNGFGKVDISPADIRLERGVPVRGWLAMLAV